MFDSPVALADLDPVQLAASVTDNQAVLHHAECRVLELACAWADVHSREPGDNSPLVERARFYGARALRRWRSFVWPSSARCTAPELWRRSC
jgi:hypothetical protein